MGESETLSVMYAAAFKDAKEYTPVTEVGELTIDIYFICEDKLYKGEYHQNGNYYAYKAGGGFDCFASKAGMVNGYWTGIRTNKICVSWCYINELKIIS